MTKKGNGRNFNRLIANLLQIKTQQPQRIAAVFSQKKTHTSGERNTCFSQKCFNQAASRRKNDKKEIFLKNILAYLKKQRIYAIICEYIKHLRTESYGTHFHQRTIQKQGSL